MRKIRRLSLLALSFILINSIQAQFTKLYDFTHDYPGYYPQGSLISDGTYFYGVTGLGGFNNGVIFKVKPDGTGYTVLKYFDGANSGSSASGSLLLSGSTLYGVASSGGANSKGTIYKINTDGTGFTKLLDFDGAAHGSEPRGSLVISGLTLYGTTYSGGANDMGCIYKINTDGSLFSRIIDFDGTTKGERPYNALTISGTVLYGMTAQGGTNGFGVVFKVNTDGSAYTKLLEFNGANGKYPYNSLVLSGSTLFGTTSRGGVNDAGVIFKVKTNGTGFTLLAELDGTNKGDYPISGLLLSGSTLYGNTYYGGTNSLGVIFKVDTLGAGFTKLIDFDRYVSGAQPSSSFIISGSVLYSMTQYGGPLDNGILYKINTDGSGFSILGEFNKASNGIKPSGSLTVSGSVMYGMTGTGGTYNKGTIFKINTDGTGYTKLFDFDGPINGRNPYTSLMVSGSVMYGATYAGGTNDKGVLFKINTNGTGFVKLLEFNGSNGQNPSGSPILSGSTLYGLTSSGGMYSQGVAYKINTDGTGFVKIIEFDGTKGGSPSGDLLISGSVIYGAASWGGDNGAGTLFKVNTDGTGFSKLLNFETTANGSNPNGSLILDNNVLYGTTVSGGVNTFDGVVFKMNTDGTGFKKLVDFNAATTGKAPGGALTLCGSMLYGITTGAMGSKDVVFAISTDGTGFTELVDFDGPLKGSSPQNLRLAQKNNELYGMTNSGGADNVGVIFRIIMPSIQATKVDTVYNGSRTIKIKWRPGNGTKRIVFMKQASSGSPVPVNGTTYTANSFAKGTQIASSGWYCVYSGKDTTAIINGLTPNRNYMIKVCEFIGDTLTPKYNVRDTTGNPYMITTIKDKQTITFSSLSPYTYGTADFNPGATSDKGLVIVYTSSDNNIVSIVGGKLHTVNVGTCDIYANQLGDDTTFAAAQMTQQIKVQKATLTIKADNKSRDYFTKANTKFTISYSGFVNGDDSTDLTTLPTVSCANKDTSRPGAYPIIPLGATAANYTIVYENGVLTINPSLIQLCVVRYDVSEKRNMIVWERVKGMNIKSYKILKEKSTNVYDTLGTVAYNAPTSYFIDTVSNPDVQAIKYKICAVDSSNLTSVLSSYHRSINLSKIPGSVANQLVLIWNEYDDESKVFVPSNYHIYRDNASGKFSLYVDQPAGLPSYNVNVNNVVPGEQFQIVVDKTVPCNPTLPYKAESGPYSQSLSNIVEFKTTGLNSEYEIPVCIFPNPVSDVFNIQIYLTSTANVKIEIVNELGKAEYNSLLNDLTIGQNTITLSSAECNLSTGMHFVKIMTDNKVTIKKINCFR